MEITAAPDEVDLGRLSSYYGKDECELFVRIANFERETMANQPTTHQLVILTGNGSTLTQPTRPTGSESPTGPGRTRTRAGAAPGPRRVTGHSPSRAISSTRCRADPALCVARDHAKIIGSYWSGLPRALLGS